MSNKLSIHDLYLKSARFLHLFDRNNDGLLSYMSIAGKYKPYHISVKTDDGTVRQRLCLPTKERMKNGDFKDCFVYHPICENTAMGQSTLIRNLKNVGESTVLTLLGLAIELRAVIASNGELQAKIESPEDKEFLGLPDMDLFTEKAAKDLLAIMNNMSSKNVIVRTHLAKDDEIAGEPFRRSYRVHFPIMDELEKAKDKPKDNPVFGVKISSKNAVRGIIALLNSIVEMNNPERYAYGTNSKVAPFWKALIMGTANLYKDIMAVINGVPENLLVELDKLQTGDLDGIDFSWLSAMDDLSVYLHDIPSFQGNAGSSPRQVAGEYEVKSSSRDREVDVPEPPAELESRDTERRSRRDDRDDRDDRRDRDDRYDDRDDRDDRRSRRDDRDDEPVSNNGAVSYYDLKRGRRAESRRRRDRDHRNDAGPRRLNVDRLRTARDDDRRSRRNDRYDDRYDDRRGGRRRSVRRGRR